METAAARPPRVIRWALALGIAIVLNVFFYALAALAVPPPMYDQYCPARLGPVPQSQAVCESTGGSWVANQPTAVSQSEKIATPTGYCDLYTRCQVPYEQAVSRHALEAFALMVGLGILVLIIGLLPLGSAAIATGLSYGGVLALVIASVSYWGSAGSWVRLLIATAGLAALLYVGWKRFRDDQ